MVRQISQDKILIKVTLDHKKKKKKLKLTATLPDYA